MHFSGVLLILFLGFALGSPSKISKKRARTGYTKEEIESYKGYDELDRSAWHQKQATGGGLRSVPQTLSNQGAYTSETPRQADYQITSNQLSTTNSFSQGSDLESITPVPINPIITTTGYSTENEFQPFTQISAHPTSLVIENQNSAANQAAYLAQITLANTALREAATANAALAAKEVVVKQLETEQLETSQRLDSEIAQFEQSKKSTSIARASADQTAAHVAKLTAALNSARLFADEAAAASRAADAGLASQTAMVGRVKGLLDSIASKLKSARIDYQATKLATEKALNYAQQAEDNANVAGEHASAKFHEVPELRSARLTFPRD